MARQTRLLLSGIARIMAQIAQVATMDKTAWSTLTTRPHPSTSKGSTPRCAVPGAMYCQSAMQDVVEAARPLAWSLGRQKIVRDAMQRMTHIRACFRRIVRAAIPPWGGLRRGGKERPSTTLYRLASPWRTTSRILMAIRYRAMIATWEKHRSSTWKAA